MIIKDPKFRGINRYKIIIEVLFHIWLDIIGDITKSMAITIRDIKA
ncbi:hypothetical protein KY347_05795 [Candidatus Woesearchaeota archaeon]|nr:hypothetical protein [Candidatus Woesearchaeota archaeon]